ncbi:MFS transporter [Blastococcus sp. URHD0036]|uniref:MFS transporter n=1 Tax=Blastococcus sp. URHD0036 TaxID=1380356 RepID=UPI000553A2B2|nr:MFS transporter [Blastococcus sp. URHD0036]
MSSTTAPLRRDDEPAAPRRSGIWNRQLPHYPENGPRSIYLGITVLATVVLYYELYVGGSVATRIIADLGFSFTFYVFVSVIGNLVGAFASLFAGLADRWGRANLVVYGLLLTGLITLFGLPHAPNKGTFTVLFAILSFVEGVVLVATPALIRDFSPQVGRGVAMGFWTLGPVLGSLVVTLVSSNTLDTHDNWRFQFYVCGIAGLVVFVIAFFGLKELSPALRDQLMVSMRDRALIEARAAGIDPEKALKGHWRQMLRFDVIGSAFAISVFLLLYYILVGFTVVYFATVYGYTEQQANSLANWYWITNAIALVVTGVLTDRFRVRKPFMIVGALIGLVGSILFALSATDEQSYHTIAFYFVLAAAGGGMAYVAWMASFTETVERHNPAATATGLAVWGWTLRIVVTVSLAVFTLVVPATSILVDKAPAIQEMQADHPEEFEVITNVDQDLVANVQADPTDADSLGRLLGQVAAVEGADADTVQSIESVSEEVVTAQAIDPDTLAALQADSGDATAIGEALGQIQENLDVDSATALERLIAVGSADQDALAAAAEAGATLQAAPAVFSQEQLDNLAANGQEVADAVEDNPGQWQTWWWVCIAGQIVFIPFVFVMAGRWSPRRARQDEQVHEEKVQRELAALRGES